MEKEFEVYNKKTNIKQSLLETVLNKISFILKKNNKVSNAQDMSEEHKKEKKELENYVHSLIKNERIKDIIEVTRLGYTMPHSQSIEMENLIKKYVKTISVKEIELLCSEGLKVSPAVLIRNAEFVTMIMNSDNLRVSLTNYPQIDKIISENIMASKHKFMDDMRVSDDLLEAIELGTNYIVNHFLLPIKLMFLAHEKFSVEDLTDLKSMWNDLLINLSLDSSYGYEDKNEGLKVLAYNLKIAKACDMNVFEFDRAIDSILSDKFKSVENSMKSRIGNFYMKDGLKTLTTDIAKDIASKVDINTLPAEATQKIRDIETGYNKIVEYKSLLNEEDIRVLDNLVKTQMPNAITRFMIIDKEYHNELKNAQGKYPKDLMLDTLSIIESRIKDMIRDINQEHVHALSVTNRVASSMK